MTTKLNLKGLLFDAYGGFADKRYKKIQNDAPFIVDDRSRGDYDARGQMFLWFCQMFARDGWGNLNSRDKWIFRVTAA